MVRKKTQSKHIIHRFMAFAQISMKGLPKVSESKSQSCLDVLVTDEGRYEEKCLCLINLPAIE